MCEMIYFYHILDRWFADEGEDGFGAVEGEWSHSGAIAAYEYDGFHDCFLTNEYNVKINKCLFELAVMLMDINQRWCFLDFDVGLCGYYFVVDRKRVNGFG